MSENLLGNNKVEKNNPTKDDFKFRFWNHYIFFIGFIMSFIFLFVFAYWVRNLTLFALMVPSIIFNWIIFLYKLGMYRASK